MFEGKFVDTCAGKFPLVSMGVRAECPAFADTGVRTPIGTSRILVHIYLYFSKKLEHYWAFSMNTICLFYLRLGKPVSGIALLTMIHLQQSGGSVLLSQLLHFLLNGESSFPLEYIFKHFWWLCRHVGWKISVSTDGGTSLPIKTKQGVRTPAGNTSNFTTKTKLASM